MTTSYGSGYYAAASPKKRPPYFLIALGAIIVAGVAGIYLWRGSGEADAAAAAPLPVVEAVSVSDSEVAGREELEAENQELRRKLALFEDYLSGGDVDAHVRKLEAEIDRLKGELDHYRAALDRAVEEMNKLSAAASAVSGRPQRRQVDQSADIRARLREGLVFVDTPYAALNMGSFNVSGEVRNNNPEPVKGYVVLRLLSRGKVSGEKRVSLTIPAKEVVEYFATIPGGSVGGSYEVTATWQMAE